MSMRDMAELVMACVGVPLSLSLCAICAALVLWRGRARRPVSASIVVVHAGLVFLALTGAFATAGYHGPLQSHADLLGPLTWLVIPDSEGRFRALIGCFATFAVTLVALTRWGVDGEAPSVLTVGVLGGLVASGFLANAQANLFGLTECYWNDRAPGLCLTMDTHEYLLSLVAARVIAVVTVLVSLGFGWHRRRGGHGR